MSAWFFMIHKSALKWFFNFDSNVQLFTVYGLYLCTCKLKDLYLCTCKIYGLYLCSCKI